MNQTQPVLLRQPQPKYNVIVANAINDMHEEGTKC